MALTKKKNAVSVSLSGEISDDLAEIFAEAYQAAGITLGRARNVAVAPTNAREHAAAYANQRGGDLITEIDDTTHEAVQRVVSGALKRGESDTDVKEKLSNIFGDQRAEMIARTEMQTAYNLGVVRALKDAGEEYVYVDDGDEYDEECQNADGEYWTIEEAEANPLEHPNCQRTFRPLSDDELAEVMAEEEADDEEGFSAKDAARFNERLERALFFSEDQERDEHGRWTKGGGSELLNAAPADYKASLVKEAKALAAKGGWNGRDIYSAIGNRLENTGDPAGTENFLSMAYAIEQATDRATMYDVMESGLQWNTNYASGGKEWAAAQALGANPERPKDQGPLPTLTEKEIAGFRARTAWVQEYVKRTEGETMTLYRGVGGRYATKLWDASMKTQTPESPSAKPFQAGVRGLTSFTPDSYKAMEFAGAKGIVVSQQVSYRSVFWTNDLMSVARVLRFSDDHGEIVTMNPGKTTEVKFHSQGRKARRASGMGFSAAEIPALTDDEEDRAWREFLTLRHADGQKFYSETQPRDEHGRFTDGAGGEPIRAENKIANLTPAQQAHQRALKAARSRAFKQRQAAIKAGLPIPPKTPPPTAPPVAPKTPPVATTPPQVATTAPPAPTTAPTNQAGLTPSHYPPGTYPPGTPGATGGPPGMEWTPQGWRPAGQVVQATTAHAMPEHMDPLHSYEGDKPDKHLEAFGIKVTGADARVREGWGRKGNMKNAIKEGLKAVAKLPAQHLDGIRSVQFVTGFGRRRANGTYQGFGQHISLLNARTIEQTTGPGENKWYSARGTAIHEVGHHVHMSKLTDDAAREWAALSRGNGRYGGSTAKISDYARTDYTEHFAEAYRAYHLGGEFSARLKIVEPEVHAFMVKVHEPHSSYLLPRGQSSSLHARSKRGGNKSGSGY